MSWRARPAPRAAYAGAWASAVLRSDGPLHGRSPLKSVSPVRHRGNVEAPLRLSRPYSAVRGRSNMSRGVAGPARIGVVLGVLGAALVGSASASATLPVKPVCSAVKIHHARCFSLLVKGSARPFDGLAPSGYGPPDLQSAYKVPSATAGAGQTVAIVDAFDDPTAESDMAKYRSFYGLPPCTAASGCFRKVNQTGGTLPPPPSPDWALEISLDLDMVSAICPNCKILLVEANTNLDSDLYAAEDTAARLGANANLDSDLYAGEDAAARLGANAISNSWGGDESSDETANDVHFNHPGIAITASSGDNGFGVSYPAASPKLTAVGGTSLTRGGSGTRGWTEAAWDGAGSGCSAFEAKPSWQTDSGCARRTVS